LTRIGVLIALGEKLKDPRAVPSLEDHLSDSDPYVRYAALDGLKNIPMKTLVRCLPSGRNKMSNRKYRFAKFGGSKSASYEVGRKIKSFSLSPNLLPQRAGSSLVTELPRLAVVAGEFIAELRRAVVASWQPWTAKWP